MEGDASVAADAFTSLDVDGHDADNARSEEHGEGAEADLPLEPLPPGADAGTAGTHAMLSRAFARNGVSASCPVDGHRLAVAKATGARVRQCVFGCRIVGCAVECQCQFLMCVRCALGNALLPELKARAGVPALPSQAGDF